MPQQHCCTCSSLNYDATSVAIADITRHYSRANVSSSLRAPTPGIINASDLCLPLRPILFLYVLTAGLLPTWKPRWKTQKNGNKQTRTKLMSLPRELPYNLAPLELKHRRPPLESLEIQQGVSGWPKQLPPLPPPAPRLPHHQYRTQTRWM
jgi:hypothetical protein